MRLTLNRQGLGVLLEDRIKEYFYTAEGKEIISIRYGVVSHHKSEYCFASYDGGFKCVYPLGFDYIYYMNSGWGKLGELIEKILHIRFWCYCIISFLSYETILPYNSSIIRISK